jgi:hypothetical protein
VFGRSHNDFVASVSVTGMPVEELLLVSTKFDEGSDEVLH